MEYEVTLNPAGIRKLREAKSWTQEHLATAAGLSIRTVQRMELEGLASSESRLAVAAALGVPVENIHLAIQAGPDVKAAEVRRIVVGTRYGYAGLLLGALASAAGIISGGSSSGEVASSLGILGAFTGIVAAAIGMFSHRAIHRATQHAHT